MKNVFRKCSILVAATVITACSQPASEQESTSLSSSPASQNQNMGVSSIVSFKLTDAPNKELKSVVVDIDHMEVLLGGSGKAGRLVVAKGLGTVDLLTLQNGVTLPLQDVIAPAGLEIQQIRLVLKPEGHYAVKADNSICALKTPSAQKTGVKIILTNKVQFEAGHQYNIVVDFDALKSVVIQGNGECLLKPVLKLKSAFKSLIPAPEEPASDAGEGNDSGSGSDSGAGTDSGTDPNAGSGSETGAEEPAGEELVTVPEQNDSSEDGWGDPVIIDGQEPPVMTEDQLYQLL